MKTILMIDDEAGLCYFVKANLQRRGDYDVAIETDAQRGFEAARLLHPDLILLDILMPGMNGFEVLRRLKEEQETVSIPVLMLTALGDEESKRRAGSLYDEDYIEKPVEIETLESKIQRVLSRLGKNDKGYKAA